MRMDRKRSLDWTKAGSGEKSPVTFNCIRGGETIDTRKIQEGWDKAGFNDEGWQGCSMVTPPDGKLEPQSMPAEQVTDLVKPVSLTRAQAGRICLRPGTAHCRVG
ncbi:MAG: alpha-L-rhamnosidase N-terminal domain-containing protein [Mangrovibacterium sp.]